MKDIPFEKGMEKLEKIVEDLENGDLSLDESLKKYEEGIDLARHCQSKLDKAREKVEILIKKGEGFRMEPFSEEDLSEDKDQD